MGRPLQRKMFGPLDGTSADGFRWSGEGEDQHGNVTTSAVADYRKGYNMPVEAARIVGGTTDEGGDGTATPYILWQKGSRRWRVRTAEGDGFCRLVDGESALNEGEMVLAGFVDDAGEPVALRKLSGRKAYDFAGNSYTWYVEVGTGPDSTYSNRIILTAI